MLNLGGADVDTHTPEGSTVCTMMAVLAQMESKIKGERITDSVAKRRAAGKDLGGRRQTFTDPQIRNVVRLIESGETTTQVARDVAGHLVLADARAPALDNLRLTRLRERWRRYQPPSLHSCGRHEVRGRVSALRCSHGRW
ncbi:recombinase family protein [Kocuria sabuli]|uniref:recombinase family protein n=1 Tax=Kocuria sabuli TaxID=3071448 RepID=UPI0034D3E4FA